MRNHQHDRHLGTHGDAHAELVGDGTATDGRAIAFAILMLRNAVENANDTLDQIAASLASIAKRLEDIENQ